MEWVLLITNFAVCMGAAWVCMKVQQQEFPAPATFIAGVITMFIWSALVRFSAASLVVVSAWYDVTTTLGYFAGYALCGLCIAPSQWVGMVFLVTGLLLINHRT